MRLSARSYPHPVLGNRDDVPGAAFQATIEMSTDRQLIYLEIRTACSCEVLNGLLSQDKATRVLHVECSNTLYRKAFAFRELEARVSIPVECLHSAVEVNVFVLATERLDGYRIPAAHDDYEGSTFCIRRGDILAIGEGRIFHVESDFDSLGRIGSIMQINESPFDGDLPMEPSFDGEKIVIFLSKRDFTDYKALRHNASVLGPLTTTIVLPVLIEALRVVTEDSDGRTDTRRWVRALWRRVEEMELSIDAPPLELAQKLLELPVRRALASSRMLAEATP